MKIAPTFPPAGGAVMIVGGSKRLPASTLPPAMGAASVRRSPSPVYYIDVAEGADVSFTRLQWTR